MRSPGLLTAPGADWNPLGVSNVAAGPSAGSGFGTLYSQLQGEVQQFIETGGGDAAAVRTPALSADGQWRLLQQQGFPASGAPSEGADPADQQAFVERMTPLAQPAAAQLGVAPDVLVAQAALESGWGRHPIRRADGSDSNNLFGLKAQGAWTGEVAVAGTTEFDGGQPHGERAGFRAYSAPAQSFQDLASLLAGNPRFGAALGTGADALAYGHALQQGGYATDPAYADKLARVANQLQAAKPRRAQP